MYRYSGSAGRGVCSRPEDHPAHITGWYNTTRFGRVDRICPGKGPESAEIIRQGDAATLSVFEGPTLPEEAEIAQLNGARREGGK